MAQAFSNNVNSFNVSNSFNYTTVNYTNEDESEILAWLSPLEPWARHHDIGDQRVDSIGTWLLETEEFRRWQYGTGGDESNHPALFCGGNPGVGKSYITSLVIDKLYDEAVEEDATVICFYFDFAARNAQSPVNMLGSLLRQLVSGPEGIPEVVAQGFREQRRSIGGRGLQVSGILKMFQTITATKRTFICVDAIDECAPEHRVIVLESLRLILQGSLNTRIFLTGRPGVRSEVERIFGGAATFISIQLTKDGVVQYLRDKLRSDTTPEIMSSALEAEIMKTIPEINLETFLLASLHIEAILRETTIARRKRVFESIRDGAELGDTYGATLERIGAQDKEKVKLAMATLTWICHSERPLQVDELCHALAVEIRETDFDLENIPSIGTLSHCCQGLIIVDKEASTVRLIHHTVQEYLCRHPGLFSKPHSILAETCLTYLGSQQVKNLTSHSFPDHHSMPFLKYSSRYWGTHAGRDLSDLARTLALELLDQYGDHVSAASLLKQEMHPSYTEDIGTSPLFSGLHGASFFGIVELVAAMIDTKGCEIDQRDCTGSTPLVWAARNGHVEAAKLLLERENVDPNRADWYDRTPLGCAAVNGRGGVVKLLLEREGVDPNRPDKDSETPLGWASISGHEEVVKLLLGREDVNPNSSDVNGRTPLACAAVEGHEGVIELLLGREDVDLNRADGYDRTPLGCAAVNGHEGAVKLLLGREDADPNRPDKYYRTPLGCAAVNGHEGVVKLFLEREDVNPNLPDKDGETPLGWAAISGHEGVVRLLLRREDVDPNSPDANDRTPLGCAAVEGHERVIKLLLGREDVDPNRPDKSDQTPLWCAAFMAHDGVIKLLLGREDVDPNRPDVNDQTPLGCAAVEGHEGVVKLLLQREDIDINRPDKYDQTPVVCAAVKGHEGVVKILLEQEA